MAAVRVPRRQAYDIRDYGAVCDGTTDDAAAVAAAWTAMISANGGTYAAGVLVIPGKTYLASAVVLNGGYTSVATTSASDWAEDAGHRVTIRCDGPIVCPTSSVGSVLTVKGMLFPRLDIRFHGGGHSSDYALHVQDVYAPDLSVDAHECAATILYMNGTTAANKVRSASIRKINATSCGRALHLVGIEGFGQIIDVWDCNNTNGSHFDSCADIGIGHYESFHPTSQTYGVHFEDCNSFNVGILSLGDRASTSLLRIEGGDFGRISQIRASGASSSPGPRNTIGVQLVEVSSVHIAGLHTFRCSSGLEITGGGTNKITIDRHYSMTADGNPLRIKPGTGTAPKLTIGCDYRQHQSESVLIDSGLTGGFLELSGWIRNYNVLDSASIYCIDCNSADFVVDVTGLYQEVRSVTAGFIDHSTPDNVLGVPRARLENNAVWGATGTFAISDNTAFQNATSRTAVVHVPITFAANGTADLHFGPKSDTLANVGQEKAVDAGDVRVVQLRIPPWWWAKIDVDASSTIGTATRWYE